MRLVIGFLLLATSTCLASEALIGLDSTKVKIADLSFRFFFVKQTGAWYINGEDPCTVYKEEFGSLCTTNISGDIAGKALHIEGLDVSSWAWAAFVDPYKAPIKSVQPIKPAIEIKGKDWKPSLLSLVKGKKDKPSPKRKQEVSPSGLNCFAEDFVTTIDGQQPFRFLRVGKSYVIGEPIGSVRTDIGQEARPLPYSLIKESMGKHLLPEDLKNPHVWVVPVRNVVLKARQQEVERLNADSSDKIPEIGTPDFVGLLEEQFEEGSDNGPNPKSKGLVVKQQEIVPEDNELYLECQKHYQEYLKRLEEFAKLERDLREKSLAYDDHNTSDSEDGMSKLLKK